MRTWRVGSFSMGAALVFLGVFLLLAQVFKWDPAIALLSWWPLLYIILGIEILIYLGRSNKEKQLVNYDFVSIIFISVIGTVGLGFALLSSNGLLEQTTQFVTAEVRTLDLPKYEEAALDGIERVQVDPGPYSFTIEGTANKEVSIFGTYMGEITGDSVPTKTISDYALIEKKGDTLYIKIKQMPYNRFSNAGGDIEAMMLIPSNMTLEVNGRGSLLTVKPRKLESSWTVADAGRVELEVASEENITVNVHNIQELGEGNWENKIEKNEDHQGTESAHLIFGTGEHNLTIKNANAVEVK